MKEIQDAEIVSNDTPIGPGNSNIQKQVPKQVVLSQVDQLKEVQNSFLQVIEDKKNEYDELLKEKKSSLEYLMDYSKEAINSMINKTMISKKKLQNVVWEITLKNGKVIEEYDKNDKETVFTDILEPKEDFIFISLIDLKNGNKCGINLKNGELFINGIPFNVEHCAYGVLFGLNDKMEFAKGIIQYKCPKPVMMGRSGKVEPETFNIGYKVDTSIKWDNGSQKLELIKLQVLLSIYADDGKISTSSIKTVKITDQNGKENIVKF